MFGENRIRCKIVNYSDSTILQQITDEKHKKSSLLAI